MSKKSKASIFNRVIPFNNGRGKITVQFNQSNTEEPATIQIYEEIGEDPWTGSGFSAKDFADALADIPRSRPIDVRLNSPGGLVWDGLAIKTRFNEWPARKTLSIDGMAASTASWAFLDADEIRAPKHAQMFVHQAWGGACGFADDLRRQADDLDKSTGQIAEMYAKRTGSSKSEWINLMENQTLMTGEEAKERGLIDVITDDEPIDNFTQVQISNMKSRLETWNRVKLSAAPAGQPSKTNQNEETEMNRAQMIALLNKWGVKFDEKASDEDLNALVENGKPKSNPAPSKNKVKYKDGESGEHADDCDCDSCDPKTEDKNRIALDKQFKNLMDRLDRAEQRELVAKRNTIEIWAKGLVESDQLPAAQMDAVIELAIAAPDLEKFQKPFNSITPRAPGFAPVPPDIAEGEITSVDGLNKAVEKLTEPQRYMSKNRIRPDVMERALIGNSAKSVSQLINRLKKFDGQGNLIGPLVDMWNQWAVSSPRNANTMSADLLRQVILSEIMRAFKRQFTSISFFAHTYQNVPLEGSDFVKVPYYPLDTTASTEFVYSAGYVVTPGAVTNAKSILVGGVGTGVATSGSGRKYKGLQFSAYEIRRQPWLNIAQLTVMAGEQLAIDVRADIIGTQISKANFGAAIWSGLAGAFDHTVVAQYLQNAAIKAFWPETMRNAVIAPDYYTALAADPAITPFLSIGTTEILRQGVIGGLYSFQSIMYDALVPVTTFIRGGDGAATGGNDLNLAGYIAYPSAVLVATAPLMPPPGVLKKLVSYEQVTDDQTGLSITYQYFGLELNNVDNEIIECTYGSGLGEVAALKRIVSAGT